MTASDRPYLDTSDMSPDPISQFSLWYAQAEQTGQPDPETCCLSTATAEGKPSARIVLLKKFDSSGFVVFTNYASRKAKEIEANPYAALTFYWPVLGRQVRIEGRAARTSREDSLAYFTSRPYESRLGAWASPQSTPIPDRNAVVDKFELYKAKYPDPKAVPLPDFWGGYRIAPQAVEFWQQSSFRLHDRFRYSMHENTWKLERLAP